MYRTELQPQHLNPRGVHRFRLGVVAVLAFSAGATSVAYPNRLGPFDSGAGMATPALAAAPRAGAAGTDLWRPPNPATSSVYHGRPERIPATALTATATRGCAWAPPVPTTSSVYGPDCLVPTLVPASNAP